MRVLLVEDDAKLSRLLERALGEDGFAAVACQSGRRALDLLGAGGYDVIVLDWMLPDVDGVTVCRELRARGDATPVLMLTARGEVKDRVHGLESGADDYLVKPFEVEELVARLKALRRRAGSSQLRIGPLLLDRAARRAVLDGKLLDLTPLELSLLSVLAESGDRPVPKAELLERVWSLRFDPGSGLVEVHVSRLRDKLGAHAALVETVRGKGYRLRAEPKR